jgi:hypothetical protein
VLKTPTYTERLVWNRDDFATTRDTGGTTEQALQRSATPQDRAMTFFSDPCDPHECVGDPASLKARDAVGGSCEYGPAVTAR